MRILREGRMGTCIASRFAVKRVCTVYFYLMPTTCSDLPQVASAHILSGSLSTTFCSSNASYITENSLKDHSTTDKSVVLVLENPDHNTEFVQHVTHVVMATKQLIDNSTTWLLS